MGTRNLEQGFNYCKGAVYLDLSFLTNGTSNPLLSTLRGAGADVVASITYVATGKYTIVLKDAYRYIVGKTADLEDIASPDGSYASIGNVSGEGSGPLTFVASTFVAAGTLTAFTGRRLTVSLVLKNSTVGV